MKYAEIKVADVGNGPGVRISLFVSGCSHACPGCFNWEAQDYNFGKDFNDEVIEEIVSLLAPDYIQGLTLLGGEPMDPVNQVGLHKLILKVRETYGDTKDIWSWTGYSYPNDFRVRNGRTGRAYTEYTDEILKNLDVLVDGPWRMELFDIRLKWRGSANQRVIDMKQTLANNELALVPLDEPTEEIWESIYKKAERRKRAKRNE